MSPPSLLPCPQFTISIDLPSDPAVSLDPGLLPAKAGVFALEDEFGRTLALSASANLRRAVLAKLQPPAADTKPSKCPDYRSLTRRVVALRVGSGFEADWAWLQHARQRLPQTYKAALDRWQAWFVQCDPAAEFPQFTKTAHPRIESGSSLVHLGPFADKHAAGRYIEMLEDAFDLCRYHHILVQSPRGTACAYKEMGRCPAPCDGTVTMDHYHTQVLEAVEFATTAIEDWRAHVEAQMHRASESLDFEAAQRYRQRLDRTAIATRPEFTHVDRLERFAYVAVMPGETVRFARIFLVRGGWIDGLRDIEVEDPKDECDSVMIEIRQRAQPQAADFCDAAIENIGLVCWRLFRPRGARERGTFLHLNDALSADHLLKAVRSLRKSTPTGDEEDTAIIEHEAENLTPENQNQQVSQTRRGGNTDEHR